MRLNQNQLIMNSELIMRFLQIIFGLFFIFFTSVSFAQGYKCVPEKGRGSVFVKKNMLDTFYFNTELKQFKFENFKLTSIRGGSDGKYLFYGSLSIENPFIGRKDFIKSAGNRGTISYGSVRPSNGKKLKDIENLFINVQVFQSNKSFNLKIEGDWGFVRGKCSPINSIPGIELNERPESQPSSENTVQEDSSTFVKVDFTKPFLSAEELRFLGEIKGNDGINFKKSEWYKHKKKKDWWNKNGHKASLLIGPPRCVSAYSGFYGGSSYEAEMKRELQNEIRERMAGFPTKVIEYCTKITFAIKNGKMTNYPINEKRFFRSIGTLIIRDSKTKKIAPVRAMIETDYLGERTGGNVYNQNLEKVCGISNLSRSGAVVHCANFGTINAKFTVTNLIKGDFKLFGKNDNFEFFVTNLNMEETKKKYKSLFK